MQQQKPTTREERIKAARHKQLNDDKFNLFKTNLAEVNRERLVKSGRRKDPVLPDDFEIDFDFGSEDQQPGISDKFTSKAAEIDNIFKKTFKKVPNLPEADDCELVEERK